jgi:Soluble lytic murein transglycosylase and related regulatory proteins (some contain LysM/invasin domains)
MPRLVLALSFFAILMGCATTSKKDTRLDTRIIPPLPTFLHKWSGASNADLEALTAGAREENINWWRNYTLGLRYKDKEPAKACAKFKDLANTVDFPLHDVALLRAYESCPRAEKLPELPKLSPSWYRDLYADIKLKESSETPELNDDFDALIEKAKIDSNKKNKEEFYKKALAAAQKLNDAEKIAETEKSLYKNSPRLNPEPTDKELFSVASDYRFYREFDKAIDTYNKILQNKKSSFDDIFQAQKNIRQTYKVAQRRVEYINATAELVNRAKANFEKNKKDRLAIARYHDSQVLFARTLWTEDQTSQAVKVLNETHRRLRGLYPMDEVFFILGRIDEEKGNFEKALEYFEGSFKQPVSMADLREKIAWLKSWNYYKLKKYPEAVTSFQEMKDTVKDPSDKARAQFWLSRSLRQTGEEAKAKEGFEALMKDDPLGYYGVLARRELKENFSGLATNPEQNLNLSLLNLSEVDTFQRLTAEWLIAVDEKSFSTRVLSDITDDLNKRKITNEQTWLTIASAYARSGSYLALFSTLGGLQPEIKNQLLNDHPDLLFPQPYGTLIADASAKSGVPSELIYSIIRQESAFDPEARSSADAFGLMQLLPSVAKQLAARYNLEYSEATDLFKPEIIIPLGAHELKTLLAKYDNQFILAASGYNANDSAIRGWLKTRMRDDSVEFIEEIPYEETRSYVKLVMRNYVFYRRLLHPQESLPFPEDLLRLKK